MMMLDHVLLGGVAGGFIQNAPLAFSFGLVSHFFLDKIPHFFPEKKPQQYLMMTVDFILSMLALGIFWFGGFPKSVFWGACGGIIVDLVLVGIPAVLETKIGQWHVDRQLHQTKPVFLIADFFVFVISAMLLWRFM